jgi:hypothetical protein
MRIPSSGVAALTCLLLTTPGCAPKEDRQGITAPDGGGTAPDAGITRVKRPAVPSCTDRFDELGRFCTYFSPFKQPRRVVIRDTEAWASLWQQLWATGSHKPALPAVDFEQELVIVAMMGERSSSGYDIVIREAVVRDSGLEATVERIEPDRTAPDSACVFAAVLTQPVAAMRVPRVAGEVRFIETHLVYNHCE